MDRLLRGEVFVDLHGIIKQGVRASVEQYSLKEMEKFCDYRRRVPLPEANQARHFIEHQLELSPSPELTDEACRVVEGYNEDDCRATEQLRQLARKPPRRDDRKRNGSSSASSEGYVAERRGLRASAARGSTV